MEQTTQQSQLDQPASAAAAPAGQIQPSAPKRIGKYVLEEFLGGGMSHVFRARDSVLGRRVAIKVLTEKGLSDVEVKARFLQEARFASNIQHENIISIFDFGVEGGRPFMVMEYVEGKSLRKAIKEDSVGDIGAKIRIAIQVGRALDFIHENKVVHRDVKPENVHIDLNGRVRLMDFGIASAAPDPAANGEKKRSDQAVGTPFYMAPEQVLGQPLTKQADVYSFGVMLFELFTGKRAVDGEDVQKIFHKILYDELDLEALQDADVPESVIGVIVRCTSKQLSGRPRSLGEVCDGLEKIIGKQASSTGKHKAVRPGMLSPSATRPEGDRVQLSMKPPPPAGRPVSAVSAEREPEAKPKPRTVQPNFYQPSFAKSASAEPGSAEATTRTTGVSATPRAGSEVQVTPESAGFKVARGSQGKANREEELELPWYMAMLPEPLQTQTGLMLIAAGSMMFLMMALFWMMSRMGVI